MAKKKSKPARKNVLDPLSFMHQPHDKYVRFVLQTRAVALQMMEYCLKKEVFAMLDTHSLALSEDSFVDTKLRSHFSDICYTGQTLSGAPFRITLLFEHKSEKTKWPVLAQLNRYINNIWSTDLRQDRGLSLTLAILIYHGKAPIRKETPSSLFPGAPEILLSYIPSFDYELLDIARIPDKTLEHLDFLLLRNILLALKHNSDHNYVDKYWEKIIIFAPEVRNESIHLEIFQATVLYLNKTSPIFNQKIKDMDNALSAAEQEVVKPYLIELYEQGMEKGMEKGMEYLILAFLKKNPTWSTEQVAVYFEIEKEVVNRVRKNHL